MENTKDADDVVRAQKKGKSGEERNGTFTEQCLLEHLVERIAVHVLNGAQQL